MFEIILIANHVNQLPTGSTAVQPNRPAAENRKGGFTTETLHV